MGEVIGKRGAHIKFDLLDYLKKQRTYAAVKAIDSLDAFKIYPFVVAAVLLAERQKVSGQPIIVCPLQEINAGLWSIHGKPFILNDCD